jgi:hypothetical protein
VTLWIRVLVGVAHVVVAMLVMLSLAHVVALMGMASVLASGAAVSIELVEDLETAGSDLHPSPDI